MRTFARADSSLGSRIFVPTWRRTSKLSAGRAIHRVRLAERGAVGLDFLDLVEIRYVKAFVEAGVSWHVLRAAHERAAEMLHVDHPFATKRFFTDGQTILTRVAEPAFLDLMGNQLAFSRILGRYLAGAEGLDFDDNDMARRWWPMGRKRLVVIDAERSFGQPIVSTEGCADRGSQPRLLCREHYCRRRPGGRESGRLKGQSQAQWSALLLVRERLNPDGPWKKQ